MKIIKERIDASDDQVIEVVYDIIVALTHAKTFPTLPRVANGLGCTEVCLAMFLAKHKTLFVVSRTATAIKTTTRGRSTVRKPVIPYIEFTETGVGYVSQLKRRTTPQNAVVPPPSIPV